MHVCLYNFHLKSFFPCSFLTALAASDILQLVLLAASLFGGETDGTCEQPPVRRASSFFNLTGDYAILLLAVDTYIAVVHPQVFPRTQTNMLYVCRGLGVPLLALLTWGVFTVLPSLSEFLFYVFPVLVIPFFYCLTARRIREIISNSSVGNSQRHEENMKLLFIMISALLIENLPCFIILIIHKIRGECNADVGNAFFRLVGNDLTFVFYFVIKSEFRSTFLCMCKSMKNATCRMCHSGGRSSQALATVLVVQRDRGAEPTGESQAASPHASPVKDAKQDCGHHECNPVEVTACVAESGV